MVIIDSNVITALVQYQGATTAAVRKIMKNVVADKLEEKYRQHTSTLYCAPQAHLYLYSAPALPCTTPLAVPTVLHMCLWHICH
eukprot:3263639-Ditylum_brightwellii.AAC.1